MDLTKVPPISPTNPNPAILIPWQRVPHWTVPALKDWLRQNNHLFQVPKPPPMYVAGTPFIVLSAHMYGIWWQFMVDDTTAPIGKQVLYRRPRLFPYYARVQRGVEKLRKHPHFICQVCQGMYPDNQLTLVQCGEDQHTALDYEICHRCRSSTSKVLQRTRRAGFYLRGVG